MASSYDLAANRSSAAGCRYPMLNASISYWIASAPLHEMLSMTSGIYEWMLVRRDALSGGPFGQMR
jgi:hypothetical protein